ncbi:MAG: tetratricopeptide repeat protein, partial [Betaproteobacteria bacterium]
MPDPRLSPIAMRLTTGDAPAALLLANAILADSTLSMPDRIAALVLRARGHEVMADRERAIVDLEGALAIDGSQARLWNELGLVCADAGRVARSISAFEHAVQVDPGYARGWNNLGNALRGVGRTGEAVRAAERATAADPGYFLAWSNLGALRREAGDDPGAALALRRALELAPNHIGAMRTLGGLLRDRGDLEGAIDLFQRVVKMDAADATSAFLLGAALAERDQLAAAREAFEQARNRDPQLLRAVIAQHLTLPMLATDVAAVTQARAAYEQGMTSLEEQLPALASGLAPDHLLNELRHTNFLLPYQGDNDTTLQRRYGNLVGAMVEARAPDWRRPLVQRVRAGSRL